MRIKPRTTAASGRAVSFADGTELSVDAVIWATGFGLDHTWVDLPVFASQGEVAHKRGVTATPGLYFLGLPWQHTRGSALLGWVKDDAQYLAQHISTYQRSLRRRPTMTPANDQFPTAISDLPACDRPDLIELSDGEAFDLRIAPVVKEIGEATVRMLAYNGSVPGPTLKVQQGSEIEVNVINDGDLEATVHWHGLRLENRYDGTHETQEPIQVGAQHARPASRSLTLACTGITRTSARTTARRWASTATCWSFPPIPITGRRCTARFSSRSTTS